MNFKNKSTAQVKVRTSAWFTLAICSLLYIISVMDRQVFSIVLEPMKKELALSDSMAGIALSIFLFFMALCAAPMGFLVDRWSRKKSIGVMAIAWSVATMMTGFCRNALVVVGLRSALGIAESGFTAGGVAMISASFPDRVRSRALAVFFMGVPIGILIASILGGYLSVQFGWRSVFFAFAVPGIILGVVAFFLKDYTSVQTVHDVGRGFWQNTFYLFKIPSLKWIYIGCGLTNFVFYGALFWSPAFLMRTMQIREDTAGLIAGGVAILGLIGTYAGGAISDIWYKKNPKGRVLAGVVGIPLGAVTGIAGFWLVFSGYYVVGLFLFCINAFAGALYMAGSATAIQEVVHPGNKGLAQSVSVLFMYIFAAPAPAIVGAISDGLGGGARGLTYGLMLIAVVSLVAIPCFLACATHYPQDMQKVKHISVETNR